MGQIVGACVTYTATPSILACIGLKKWNRQCLSWSACNDF